MEQENITKIFSQLIEDAEFKKICESNELSDIFFKLLQEYVPKYCEDYHLQRGLACKLYLYYLKEKEHSSEIKNLYEKVLLKFVGFFSLPEDTVAYLMNQDIDLNYEGLDMYGTPTTLVDALSLGLTNYPRLMGQLLDLIDGSTLKTFGNEHYELYTDTVRMNIEAGRIANAITLFESSEYKLFPVKEEVIKEKLTNSGETYIDEFLMGSSDKLHSIIMSLRNTTIPINIRRAFLNTILYSSKIKLFNIADLSSIMTVLTEEEYQRFIAYLENKALNNEITLYSLQANSNVIEYETIEKIKDNPKYLKLKK